MSDTMACVYCQKVKPWPAAFPSTVAAVCWQCTWDRHAEAEHPLPRAKRRAIRRASKAAAKATLVRQARSEVAAALLASVAVADESEPSE